MNGEHAAQEPTQALTTIEPRPIVQRIPIEQDLEMLGRAMVASHFFKDTQSASQAIVKILAGKEMGFGPVASMTGIHIFEGKVTLGATLIAAAVKRSGRYTYRVREQSSERCRIEFFEAGESVGVSEFTMDDARQAKLAGKDVWVKYPRNMLFARALTNGARWYCADVFGGAAIYTEEELGGEGYTLDTDIGQSAQTVNQTAPAEPTPAAQVSEDYEAAISAHETPVGEAFLRDDPRAVIDATLAADLDAAFTAQAGAVQPDVPPVKVRFPYTGRGLKALYASSAVDFGWNGQNDVERALGGSVSAYAKAQHWDGQADCLDRVWAELKRKHADEAYTVAGRLGANGADEG